MAAKSMCGALVAVAVALALPDCGGTATRSAGSAGASDASGGGAAEGDASSGAGGASGAPACTTTLIDSVVAPPCTSDADCAEPGAHCAPVVPGGYRTCVRDVDIATSCSTGNGSSIQPFHDACGCDGGVCGADAGCYQNIEGACGNQYLDENLCLAPCTPGSCGPGEACVAAVRDQIGVGNPIPGCVPATCQVDADCGGCSRCAPYWSNPSPGGDCTESFGGLRCTCRSDVDCHPGFTCDQGGCVPVPHP